MKMQKRNPSCSKVILAGCVAALALVSHAFAGTTFLNHFDGGDPVSGGAGTADYAAGVATTVPQFFGVGGQIVSSPAKFGSSLLRTNGADIGGRVKYQIADNWNVNKGTIEMWIQGAGVVGGFQGGGFQGLMGTDTASGAGDVRLYIYDTPNGRTLGGYQLGGGGSFWEIEQVIPAASLNADQWHHVAWAYDTVAGITATWWDGQLLRNTPDSGTVNPRTALGATQFHVGENQAGSAPFRGYIDEFRISDTIVYPTTGNFTPPTAPFTVGPVASEWAVNANGDWSTAGNWSAGVPNGVGIPAVLGSVITAPKTVALSSAVTIGSLKFDNANRYTVAGTPALTLSSTSGATIEVASGSHTISAPIAIASSTTINVAAGSVLTASGDLSATVGTSLTKSGTGTFAVKHVRVDSLSIGAGKVQVIASAASGASSGTSRVNDLTIASGAALDITNNGLVVEYAGSSPYAAIRSAILLGNGGVEGITSSFATSGKSIGYAEASSLTGTTFLGQTVDGSAVVLRLTFKGDSNLNGLVNFDDLLKLAQNYNTSADWSGGDFTYDDLVNFDDLLALAQNYGGSLALADTLALGADFNSDWTLARSLVPEPTSVTMVLSIGAIVRRRRL